MPICTQGAAGRPFPAARPSTGESPCALSVHRAACAAGPGVIAHGMPSSGSDRRIEGGSGHLIVAQEDLQAASVGRAGIRPPSSRAPSSLNAGQTCGREVGAVVLQVLRENGESVRKGDLLVRLDDTSLRESSLSAQEGLRAAHARRSSRPSAHGQPPPRPWAQGGMTSQQALEDAEVRRNPGPERCRAAQARVSSAQAAPAHRSARAVRWCRQRPQGLPWRHGPGGQRAGEGDRSCQLAFRGAWSMPTVPTS